MEVINEDDQMSNAKTASKLSDSASDEGFNSGNQSPEPEESSRRRDRRRNFRDESKKRRRNRKDNNPISKI
ncbi:Oidioi.mRNA.OKI2018_I69.chr2.g5071.t1.cds [Oikopleura dioica]|uniref:Oidioi.mRNA.OKI2018_I69.chr2.g5071.t1.cds n=1 Tax=Oikopleura dioica TaxID=34765 RepID=A0ABN7T542_OIKDI|nr:Oidioi.mRNA.OKI2018_I69.chr2.g5071.t1.cds [Oikopleura dioica]